VLSLQWFELIKAYGLSAQASVVDFERLTTTNVAAEVAGPVEAENQAIWNESVREKNISQDTGPIENEDAGRWARRTTNSTAG
jgi:hypothetical protein